jgi:hypothetical protein
VKVKCVYGHLDKKLPYLGVGLVGYHKGVREKGGKSTWGREGECANGGGSMGMG